jgi:uncharacterized membrane protein
MDSTKCFSRPSINWFQMLVIILLLAGIFFRFVNLDQKVYWTDEVLTSLQISGHTRVEMQQNLVTGEVISLDDLHRYQYPAPDKTVLDVVRVLAEDDSQHVPLHHVLAFFWVRMFGNSVLVIRSLSAFLSLMALPSAYWLCKELFNSIQTAWFTTALLSISPFYVVYAQEARPYSLYTVVILLSSAAFLRAVKVQSPLAWSVYTITLIAGIYTHVFFGLVAISHGIYLLAVEKFRFNRVWISYLFSSILALFTFIPWMRVILNSSSQFEASSWANQKSSFGSALARWVGVISRGFIDLGIGPDNPTRHSILLLPLILGLFALLVYALYFIYKSTSSSVWLFIFTLIGVTGLVFAVPDFVLGRSYGTTRFLTACIVGLQLALTHLLTTKFFFPSVSRNSHKKLWALALALVLSSGILSCALNSQAKTWWNKRPSRYPYFSQSVALVNQANQPLLISDNSILNIQSFGHALSSNVKFQLVDRSTIPDIPNSFSNVFLFAPSNSLLSGIRQKYDLEIEQMNEVIWKLKVPKHT